MAIVFCIILQTLDLQRSSLHQGLYDKNSKFMPIEKSLTKDNGAGRFSISANG
jgi:hypothetical protein